MSHVPGAGGGREGEGASYYYYIIHQLAFVTRNILFNCLII